MRPAASAGFGGIEGVVWSTASPAFLLLVRLVAEPGIDVIVVKTVVVCILVRNLVQRISFVKLIDVWQDGPVDVLGPLPTGDGVFVLDLLGDFGQLFYRRPQVRRCRRVGASYVEHPHCSAAG